MHQRLLLLLVAIETASASSIYQIRFEATFIQGAQAFTFATSGLGISRNLEGFRLRGRINIDTSLLPPPVTNPNTEVAFETLSNSPRWLSGAMFSVDNLPGFLNAIEFSTGPYPVEPVPAPSNGTNLSTPQFQQRFAVLEDLNAFRVGLIAKDEWSDPEYTSFIRDVILDLNAQGLPGIPYNPTTGQFLPFSGVPSFSTGFVRHQTSRILRDTSQGISGNVENTFVQGTFVATNVSGEVLTPEPASLGISACALVGLAWLGRLNRSRKKLVA